VTEEFGLRAGVFSGVLPGHVVGFVKEASQRVDENSTDRRVWFAAVRLRSRLYSVC
jgi:hypothetical protein